MPTYKVTDPVSGKTLKLTGDSPPTEAELNEIFGATAAPAPIAAPAGPGIASQAWDALAIPEQKSREGYEMMQKMIPGDVQVPSNIPAVGNVNAKQAMGVLKNVAPAFVDRTSLVTMGAAGALKAIAPVARGAGRLAGRGLEALSGLEHKTPGVLREAFNNPLMAFSKGKEAAGPMYEAAKAETGASNIFHGMYEPEKIVSTAKSYMAKGGQLEPSEAFTYRKAIGQLMKSGRYIKDELVAMKKEADAIAKQSVNIKMADPVYAKGAKAEALRSFLPLNKTGGASTFKTMIGGGLIPVAGPLPFAMSPIVQGAAAATAGAAAKAIAPLTKNPVRTGAAVAAIKKVLTEVKAKDYLRKARGDREKARQMAIKDGWEIPD